MAIQLAQVQETEVKPHLVTLEEYERMCVAGVFEPDTYVELIRGVIVEMAPPSPEHDFSAASINTIFVRAAGDKAYVWPQGNSIRLPKSNSRPQPDITFLRWRDDLYRGKPPAAEDVILIVEVSYTSLNYDSRIKSALYAEAGIPEYWLVNLVDNVVEIHSDPADGQYQSIRTVKKGETLALPAPLDASIAVSDVLR